MNTTQRSRGRFCARCNFAFANHSVKGSCGGDFVERTSDEGRSILAARELTKIVDASDLCSDTIDRARLLEINRAQWAAIKKAKGLLLLALEADPMMFKIHCQAALMVLRGIGDS